MPTEPMSDNEYWKRNFRRQTYTYSWTRSAPAYVQWDAFSTAGPTLTVPEGTQSLGAPRPRPLKATNDAD
jgi:hypothetical protein